MRIFLAGASGAIGRPLSAMLIAAGHDVTGTTRSAERAATIAAAGARPVVVDVFDLDALSAAMESCRPDVVIHQVTDLAIEPGEALTEAQLGRNARVRELGTRNLIEAAVSSGARRLIAQSIAWLYYLGPLPHTEDEPIVDPDTSGMTPTRRAVSELERMVTSDVRLEGVNLRYGRLYGPGTWSDRPPEPPTVHVEDAARAAVLAVASAEPGIYNIVDDDGPVSNTKAKTVLGWEPEAGR